MPRICGTSQVHQRLLDDVPGYAERRTEIENQAWELQQGLTEAPVRVDVVSVPVVVHLVGAADGALAVTDDQVQAQVDVLTTDFRARNPDAAAIPQPFVALAGDTMVEFVLAGTDPDGGATTGVTRTESDVASFDVDDLVKADATGGKDPWPADRYLNLWVCRLGGGLLGYAQFPGGPAGTDGVVIAHTAFGRGGTAEAPFDLGRTATHEVGHWLNLRHIWGDDGTGCNGSDFVADTPNQAGPNTGVPQFPSVSCNNAPNGDLFVNYMDYVDDVAMVMFTHGQVERMQAALDTVRTGFTPAG